MHGRDLGMNPEDMAVPDAPEQEGKQEILENKDVRRFNLLTLGWSTPLHSQKTCESRFFTP